VIIYTSILKAVVGVLKLEALKPLKKQMERDAKTLFTWKKIN